MAAVRAEKYFEGHRFCMPLLPTRAAPVKMEQDSSSHLPKAKTPDPISTPPSVGRNEVTLIQNGVPLGANIAGPVESTGTPRASMDMGKAPAVAQAFRYNLNMNTIRTTQEIDIDMDGSDDARPEASDAFSDLTEPDDGQEMADGSDDARSEASDALSDLTEPDDGQVRKRKRGHYAAWVAPGRRCDVCGMGPFKRPNHVQRHRNKKRCHNKARREGRVTFVADFEVIKKKLEEANEITEDDVYKMVFPENWPEDVMMVPVFFRGMEQEFDFDQIVKKLGPKGTAQAFIKARADFEALYPLKKSALWRKRVTAARWYKVLTESHTDESSICEVLGSAAKARKEDQRPLWLRLEQNDVKNPKKARGRLGGRKPKDRKKKAEAEEKKEAVKAAKAEMQKVIDEATKFLKKAEDGTKDAESMARTLSRSDGMTANKIKEAAAAQAATKAVEETLAEAMEKLTKVEEDCGASADLNGFDKREVPRLKQRHSRVQGRLEKVKAAAEAANEKATTQLHTLFVGRTCEALFEQKLCNCEIKSVRCDDHGLYRCTVEFIGFPTNMEYKIVDVNMLRAPDPAQCQPGTNCQGIFHEDGLWYDCAITEQTEKGYKVTFTKCGTKAEVKFDQIRMSGSKSAGKKRQIEEAALRTASTTELRRRCRALCLPERARRKNELASRVLAVEAAPAGGAAKAAGGKAGVAGGEAVTEPRGRFLALNEHGALKLFLPEADKRRDRSARAGPQQSGHIEVEYSLPHLWSAVSEIKVPEGLLRGALGSGTVALATAPPGSQSNKLMVYVATPGNTEKSHFEFELPEGEAVKALAVGKYFVATLSKNFLRLFTTSGTSIDVQAFRGDPVWLSAGKDELLCISAPEAGLPEDSLQTDSEGPPELHLDYILYSVTEEEIVACGRLPLSAGASLRWCGISAEGVPLTLDSIGVLMAFSSARGKWLVVAELEGAGKRLWPVRAEDSSLICYHSEPRVGSRQKLCAVPYDRLKTGEEIHADLAEAACNQALFDFEKAATKGDEVEALDVVKRFRFFDTHAMARDRLLHGAHKVARALHHEGLAEQLSSIVETGVDTEEPPHKKMKMKAEEDRLRAEAEEIRKQKDELLRKAEEVARTEEWLRAQKEDAAAPVPAVVPKDSTAAAAPVPATAAPPVASVPVATVELADSDDEAPPAPTTNMAGTPAATGMAPKAATSAALADAKSAVAPKATAAPKNAAQVSVGAPAPKAATAPKAAAVAPPVVQMLAVSSAPKAAAAPKAIAAAAPSAQVPGGAAPKAAAAATSAAAPKAATAVAPPPAPAAQFPAAVALADSSDQDVMLAPVEAAMAPSAPDVAAETATGLQSLREEVTTIATALGTLGNRVNTLTAQNAHPPAGCEDVNEVETAFKNFCQGYWSTLTQPLRFAVQTAERYTTNATPRTPPPIA